MLQPLDPRMLEALSCEGDGDEKLDFDPHNYIGGIRAHIKEGKDWAMGVWGLLMEGGQFKTLLECTKDPWYYGRMGYNDWRIIFYDPPFRDLTVRPSSGGVIRVFASEKPVQSFKIIGCRKNWPALLSWIWEYGKKFDMMKSKQPAVSVPRRPIYYKDVTMPQSLNPEVMEALAREGDVDEGMDFIQHWHMSTIRKQIREDDDWGTGVEGLMREGGRIPALTRRTKSLEYEERKGSDDWYVELDFFPFCDLILRPSPGGIVDIYAFGKCLKSFQILGCRKNWPALVTWIWEYGDRKVQMRLRQECQKRLQRKKVRRVEKSLLHQVLRPAKLKAQYERKRPAKATAIIPDNADIIMNDVDTENPLCSTVSDTANSAGPSTSDEKMILRATVEDVNIGALKVSTTTHEGT